MVFVQPCFIRKITPELKKKLEEMGYKDFGKVRLYGESQYIYCERGIFYESPCTIKSRYNTSIDCGTNEELFLAIAALRDDSDYMQWFVCPKTRMRRNAGLFGQVIGMDGHYREIVGYEWHRYENNDDALTKKINEMMQIEREDTEFLPHKATIEEIIKHFK